MTLWKLAIAQFILACIICGGSAASFKRAKRFGWYRVAIWLPIASFILLIYAAFVPEP